MRLLAILVLARQRRVVLWALLGLAAACGSSAGGRDTTVASLQDKTIALAVEWEPTSASSTTRTGRAILALGFADVGKWEGKACPIVHAFATFAGVPLVEHLDGGATQCVVNDDPACGQQCGDVEWWGDVTAVLEGLPSAVDVGIRDGGGETVATVRNPAPMATVQVLDLVEGQQVHNGDSFRVQLQPQPPATLEDIQAGFYVEVTQGIYGSSLPTSPDSPSGTAVWRVDLTLQQFTSGPVRIEFWFGAAEMRFDPCPIDFACSGTSGVEFGEFALQYVP